MGRQRTNDALVIIIRVQSLIGRVHKETYCGACVTARSTAGVTPQWAVVVSPIELAQRLPVGVGQVSKGRVRALDERAD